MSDGDDDWFERALADDPEDPDAATDDATSGSSSGDGPDDAAEAGPETPAEPTDDDADSPFENESDSPFGSDSDSGSPFEDDADSPFESESDSGSPFEDDADNPFESESGSPFDEGGNDGPGGGSLFGEDFSTAFESAGSPGGGDGPGSEFEDEDFDSDIPRIDIGIDGLDRMIQGGVPRRHLIVSMGSAGTGKTTFGLQFLHHGLENGENCVFITLEQSHSAIMSTADDRGWGFDGYEADGQLAVVDLDPVEMANSLDNIRGELPGLIEDFDADRLVLDSVSLLEMMYDNPAKRRTEVFDFTRSLKAAGVTTMLTSEASEDNPYASRHGIIEYLTDAVFHLRYVRQETRETRMAVEIQKIRNANHSRETKPYEITMDGISVYQQANIF